MHANKPAEFDPAMPGAERDSPRSPHALRRNARILIGLARLRRTWPTLLAATLLAGTLGALIGAISWTIFAALGLPRVALYAAGFGSGCGFWGVIAQHWIRRILEEG